MTEPRTTTEGIDYRARLEALIDDLAEYRDELDRDMRDGRESSRLAPNTEDARYFDGLSYACYLHVLDLNDIIKLYAQRSTP